MNVIHGTAQVDGDPTAGSDSSADTGLAADEEMGGADGGEDVEAAARRAEVTGLSRRLLAGSVLTVPVLVAVMGPRRVGLRVDPDGVDEPLVAVRADHTGDGLGGLADPPNRMAGPQSPCRCS